ncbi:MBL fold metallo-hydrolase [Candidatus Woesearchaeota archaeon]|nr:MBL fold metallo-hydrolase [Candidatus Woesearchaeota archaeon]
MKQVIDIIEQGLLRINAGTCFYIIDAEERIAIDSGDRKERQSILKFLPNVIPLESIKKLILTHAHYDNAGNFDLFPNAEIYMHEEELKGFHENPAQAVIDDDLWKKLLTTDIKKLPENIAGLEVIHTPGHTKGSICLWWQEKKALFTGDTLLENGTGRIDYPTSMPEEMGKSLSKLVPYNHKLLFPCRRTC